MSAIRTLVVSESAALAKSSPMRTGAFCARATNGHAVAATPKSVLKSRRRILPPPNDAPLCNALMIAHDSLALREAEGFMHELAACIVDLGVRSEFATAVPPAP